MLRQSATENKAAKQDEYRGPDGKIIRRSDLSDDGERVKLGLQLDPFMWAACDFYGLQSQRGMPVAIIEPSRDPCVPLRSEAPQQLLAAVEETKRALDEMMAKVGWASSNDAETQMVLDALRMRWAKAEGALTAWLKGEEIRRRQSTPEAQEQRALADARWKTEAATVETIAHLCSYCPRKFKSAEERDKHETQHRES